MNHKTDINEEYDFIIDHKRQIEDFRILVEEKYPYQIGENLEDYNLDVAIIIATIIHMNDNKIPQEYDHQAYLEMGEDIDYNIQAISELTNQISVLLNFCDLESKGLVYFTGTGFELTDNGKRAVVALG